MRCCRATPTARRTSMSGSGRASKAECEALGAELYVPSAGGCLSLISTGQSPTDSEIRRRQPRRLRRLHPHRLEPAAPGPRPDRHLRRPRKRRPARAPGTAGGLRRGSLPGPAGPAQRPDPGLLGLRRRGQRQPRSRPARCRKAKSPPQGPLRGQARARSEPSTNSEGRTTKAMAKVDAQPACRVGPGGRAVAASARPASGRLRPQELRRHLRKRGRHPGDPGRLPSLRDDDRHRLLQQADPKTGRSASPTARSRT